jgi:hypothetical protein
MKKILVSALFFLTPFFCLASDIRPGTDDYLIANGWTEEQLSTNAATEAREFFASTTSEAVVNDPYGDVLSRTGTHPLITNAWGDITEVELKKDEDKQCWSIDFTLAGDIPASSAVQANFLIYLDGDNDTTNNAPEGVRANMDKEFSIKNSETGWVTDYRWYNSAPNALTWAINKDTASTFVFDGNKLNVCIPFSEVGKEITPIWRAAVAIYDGTNTQIDVVQNTGFPPIKGETNNTINQTGNSWKSLLNWRALGIVSGVVILLGLIKTVFWFIEKKKPNS